MKIDWHEVKWWLIEVLAVVLAAIALFEISYLSIEHLDTGFPLMLVFVLAGDRIATPIVERLRKHLFVRMICRKLGIKNRRLERQMSKRS